MYVSDRNEEEEGLVRGLRTGVGLGLGLGLGLGMFVGVCGYHKLQYRRAINRAYSRKSNLNPFQGKGVCVPWRSCGWACCGGLTPERVL